MTEGSHGIERLRSTTTLHEILEVATDFEASARAKSRTFLSDIETRLA